MNGKLSAFIRTYSTPLLVIVAVVLVNLAAVTLFLRLDLTKSKAYSLSRASKKTVAALAEPLTIKVFFTRDLPAPYNGVERYLRDLLAEYGAAGNRFFNYEFYNVSSAGDAATKKNQELAMSYGINPVQVQVVQQDQVKFQQALMGMVLIHGDMIETIPEITSTDGLEYKITSAIRKMVNKVSAFSSLKDKVEIRAYLSSSLDQVGPAMNVQGLGDLPGNLQKVVDKLNDRYYGKLSFVALDPTKDPDLEQEATKEQVLSLQWRSFHGLRGRVIPAGKGFAGIIVRHQDRSELVPVLRVQSIPLFGTQYSLVQMDELEQTLAKTVESVINVNQEIGVLTGHGMPAFTGNGQGQPALSNLNRLLSEDYSIRPVNLSEGPVPASLQSLIIAGPREPFSDYELYQIDQFLMKGKSLAIFLDPFKEVSPQGQGAYFGNQQPYSVPINSGLEKLLAHYGLKAGASYVLDESCFRQKVSSLFGGGERPVYFAPIIKSEKIAKDVPYLSNIKGLVMIKAAPIAVTEQTMKDNGLAYARLFSSSDKSWEMSEKIDLNPMYLQPPEDPGKLKSAPLAYMVEGSFPSYFADKPVPEQPKSADLKAKDPKGKKGKKGTSQVTAEEGTIKKGRPGKIFLIGTSEILKDNVIDDEGGSPNAQFVLNVIDALNGRVDNAVMRTKVQRFNPLKETTPGVRTFVKTANVAGLPAMTIALGFLVLLRRKARKRAIQREFSARQA
jgi:ABC-2 type transport system permease protein